MRRLTSTKVEVRAAVVTGHKKRACPNGPCLSAGQCCDIEKHPEEKRQQNEANERRRKISKDLERLNAEVASKEKIKDQVTNPFSGKNYQPPSQFRPRNLYISKQGRNRKTIAVSKDIKRLLDFRIPLPRKSSKRP